MADEGGKFNPANFYVGVVELFAIILPGAILTFLLYKLHVLPNELGTAFFPQNPATRSVGFAVASYVAGHVLAALGYFVMTPLFEDYYASQLTHDLRTLATRARNTITDIIDLGNGPGHDSQVGREEQFRWTIAYISVHSPQASARLDSLEADCKFFRNLTPTILLSFPLINSVYCKNPDSRNWAIWISVLLIVGFLFYQGLQKPSNCPRSTKWTAIKLLLPVLILWLALMATGLSLCVGTKSQIFVNLGLGVLMLLAGTRYVVLHRKLMTSAYELLIVLCRKRPEATD